MGHTNVYKYATMALVRLARHKLCTGASVAGFSKRGSVVRENLDVRMSVRDCLAVESMFARKVAIRGNVVNVLCKERGHVLVGRKSMMECHVMLPHRCVGALVIRH